MKRPIVDGTPHSGTQDHGVVWVLGPFRGGGFWSCTGTLIHPRVVVTAAHCPDAAYVLGGERVAFGSEPDPQADRVNVISVLQHPEYSGANTGINTNDVALLLLADDAPAPATPWPVISSADANQVAGKDARIVGYGLTHPDGNSGKKYGGTVVIRSVGDRSLRIQPNPSFPCSGDSGGPLFATVGGTEYLVAVHNTGTGCVLEEDGGIDKTMARADVFVDGFIGPFLNRVASASRTFGQRCYYAGNCSEGTCTDSEARENVKYCSKACTSDTDCTGGMLCRGATGQKMCHYPRVHPEVLTGLCAENHFCQTDRCSRFVGGGVKTCTIDCTPAEQNACPTGYACLQDLTNGGNACLRASTPPPGGGGGGGCSAAGTAGGTGLGVLLALLYLMAYRRKRSGVRSS